MRAAGMSDKTHKAQEPGISGRVLVLTLAALGSFALNSLLCRAALGERLIDAPTFTLVRIASGALVLQLIARSRSRSSSGGSPLVLTDVAYSALALFLYALPFSLAYLRIQAGTGAFLLFGCVQITMIGHDLAHGRRLRWREALGLAMAVSGLAWLTRPGSGSPDLTGVLLMVVSGLAWGVYSIRGRGAKDPLLTTARNFAAAVPLTLPWLVIAGGSRNEPLGFVLALFSGALTSGLGYVAWYAAVPSLGATRASIVQLGVPPLAAALGVLLLGEPLTSRLSIAAPLILGGIGIAVFAPKRA